MVDWAFDLEAVGLVLLWLWNLFRRGWLDDYHSYFLKNTLDDCSDVHYIHGVMDSVIQHVLKQYLRGLMWLPFAVCLRLIF